MAKRIKGQEAEILIVKDGEVLDTISDIKSFEITFQLDQLSEGFLGQTTEQKDDVFKGVTGRMTLHTANDDVFDLIDAIVQKAQRRVPGKKINIKATLNYDNGDRPRVLLPDVSFGPIPLGFGSREAYGEVSLDFTSSTYQVIR